MGIYAYDVHDVHAYDVHSNSIRTILITRNKNNI